MTSVAVDIPVTPGNTLTVDRVVPLWTRISWGPIMMGAVCAIGLQFIFTVLGIAIGASSGEVTTGIDGSSVRTVGIAAGLWWLITGTVALAAGGFVFGRLSGLPRSLPLMLEAATMWAVVALFGFMVVWSGAGMLSQAASPIGAISARSLDPYSPSQTGRGMMGNNNALNGASNSGAGNITGNNNPGGNASGANISPNAAAWAEEARRATRTSSWWTVIGLLAGLGASLAGACMATPMGFKTDSMLPARDR